MSLKNNPKNKQTEESTENLLPLMPTSGTSHLPKILDICHYGDPILRDHSKPVKEINNELRQLVDDMIATMVKFNGVGLAANQVGRSKRLIVVDVGGAVPNSKEGLLVLLNPKILKKSRRREAQEEGCLSLPGLSIKVRRPRQVDLEYFQLNDGRRVKLSAEGLLARVILHEIDHLDGVLLMDKLTFWQRMRIKKQLLAIKQQTLQELKEKEKIKKAKEKTFLSDTKPPLPLIPPTAPPPPTKIS